MVGGDAKNTQTSRVMNTQCSTALLHLFFHLRNDTMSISDFVFLSFVMYRV